MSQCSNCSSLQAEVNRLQVENLKLIRRIKQLELEITRLQGVIYTIRGYCYNVAQDAMGKMKNVSKAEWAFNKGRYEVAAPIYNALRAE